MTEQLIYKTLKAALTNVDVWHNAATEGVQTIPFVRFEDNVTGAEYCKGAGGAMEHIEDHHELVIDAVATESLAACKLRNACRSALECKNLAEALDEITNVRVISASCSWHEELAAWDAQIVMTFDSNVIVVSTKPSVTNPTDQQ